MLQQDQQDHNCSHHAIYQFHADNHGLSRQNLESVDEHVPAIELVYIAVGPTNL